MTELLKIWKKQNARLCSCETRACESSRAANGGGGGIRTHGGESPTPVFKTGALDHSATPPRWI